MTMRGMDETSGSLFSYVDLEERTPAKHPLRLIRRILKDALAVLDGKFAALYSDESALDCPGAPDPREPSTAPVPDPI